METLPEREAFIQALIASEDTSNPEDIAQLVEHLDAIDLDERLHLLIFVLEYRLQNSVLLQRIVESIQDSSNWVLVFLKGEFLLRIYLLTGDVSSLHDAHNCFTNAYNSGHLVSGMRTLQTQRLLEKKRCASAKKVAILFIQFAKQVLSDRNSDRFWMKDWVVKGKIQREQS